MNKQKKIVVGLAAIVAGGGHIALRDYLMEELGRDERFELIPFLHSNTSYDTLNNLQGKITYINHFLFKGTPDSFMGFSAVPFIDECEDFVKEHNPDIMISTHASVAAAFSLVKKSLKLNYISINVIPDYGVPDNIILPGIRYVKPDYTVVLDDKAKAGIVKSGKYKKEQVIVTGYVAKKSFRDLIASYKKLSNSEVLDKIKEELGPTYAKNLRDDKTTILITGGAGGIIDKSYGLLRYIIKQQKKDPSIKERFQYIVITGTNKKYFNKLFKYQVNDNKDWSNIIPLPWINQKVYSKIQYFSDFPVLVSVAPASMNELFEAGCGPIIVYITRRGQEMGNVYFVENNHLGFYITKKKDVFKKIYNGFTKAEIERYKEEVEKYKDMRLKKIKSFPEVVANLYDKHLSGGRPEDKKRLKLKINYKLISPKVWLSIIIAALPATVLFSVLQFYKQKNKLGNSRTVKSVIDLLSKMIPV